MVNFSFYCRPSKVNKNGYAPIELAIIIDGKRVFMNLDRREKPDEYAKSMASKKQNSVKEYIDIMNARVRMCINNILADGKILNVETLREYIKYGGAKIYTIDDLFTDYLKVLAIHAEAENYSKYELVRDDFFEHIDKNKSVTEITNAIILEYIAKVNKRFKSSTAAGKITKLKSVVRFALDNDKLKINPFASVKIQKAKSNIEYLTDEEVETIRTKDLGCDRLNKVRDLFIFQCGSGMAFSDMSNLKPSDIQNDKDTYYVIKTRQKTDIEFTSVLLPYAIEVLKKYDYTLPKITNQKMNAFLKEIGILCRIQKNLHSHLARKTYCTHLINSGVSMDVVSKCAGHANTRITASVYAHLQRSTIIDEVAKIIK